jgi:hypothetical protein
MSDTMAKKIILALIVLFLFIFLALNFLGTETVNVYIDGENVTVNTNTLPNINSEDMNSEICDLALYVMNDSNSDINTLRDGINNICNKYGLNNAKIKIDSSIGENQIPVIVHVDGTSMLPTLQDGQTVLINKTHDVNVGDIVVANSDEYGGIIKRVDNINGNSIHLVSDNKNISYELINGKIYQLKGISTWVDISDISGVAIEY